MCDSSSFLWADRDTNVSVLSLYNVSAQVINKIRPNDVIFVLAPTYKNIAVEMDSDRVRTRVHFAR
jgi:hypothetical protein